MSKDQIAIVIPARYDSKRLPGKPLAKIAGVSMLKRVYDIAKIVINKYDNACIIIATDDKRIASHAKEFGADAIMTDKNCVSGSNRVLQALDNKGIKPKVIINLQGDEPLLPPKFINTLIDAMLNDESIQVCTPVTPLNWQELDELRKHKENNPYSGTTAIINKHGNALWFSKNIIPAIRNEESHRKSSEISPVYRHIGLYAYQYQALKKFDDFDEGFYEHFEGLEQLRFLESGVSIKTEVVHYDNWPSMSGVDTATDLEIAEFIIKTHGELINA